MKRTLIYSVCGCFFTGAATALTFYVDTGENSKCSGTGFCLVNPGDGNCCSARDTITKFNAGEIADDKVFDGLKIAGVTIAGADGTPVDLKGKSSEELKTMKSAATSGTAARVTKQLYDKAAGANENNVNVILDFDGGKLAGDTEEKDSVSVALDKGASLSDYTPETRGGDGLEFAGWTTGTGKTVTSVEGEKGQTVIYTATYKCPDGKELINGTCFNVENVGGEKVITDEIIDRGGNPVNPTQGHTCWRDTDGDGTYDANYCYWKVNITFHDKPTTGANDINVYYNTNKSNNGKTLNCDGGCTTSTTDKWCYEYHDERTEMCTRINMPRANGYKFRGYYYNVPNDIITQTSTTNGGAYNDFFPKNLNANDISITGHTVVVMNDTPVSTSASISIDVYGGWARDCDTSDPNVVCNLKTGIWWNVYDNLGKGDVRYDTGCVNGFVQTAGNGTYKPICESEKGEAGNISYSFIDQFGNPVSCNGPAASCELGGTFSLTSKPAVQTACGSDYELKYLITNRSNWYKPSKSNVSCSTNELGSEPRIIYGTVCNKFCTIGQHYDNLHATCVGADQGDTPNSLGRLGISMPPISTTPNSQYYGWYIVNGSELIKNLWATCSGGTCTNDCPTLRCDDGYGLTVDSTGPHCVEKGNEGGGSTFTCPTLSSLGVNPSGLTVSGPSQSGQRCTYTVSCGTNPRQELVGNGTTISCEGDGSTSANGCNYDTLRAQLNGFTCQIACPTSIGSAHNVEVRFVERSDANTCKYKVFCHADCTGGTLLYDDAIIGTCADVKNIYVTCSGDDCFSPMSPNPDVPSTGINPSLFFSKYDCTSSPNFTKCPGVAWFKNGGHLNAGDVSLASPYDYTLPAGITMIPQSSTPSNTGQCKYNMGCESGTLSGTTPFTCSGDTECAVAAVRQTLGTANYACGTSGGGTLTCPNPTDSGVNTLEHGTVEKTGSTSTSCTYKFTCETGYQLQGNATAACNGTSGCTKSWLNVQIGARSCQASQTKTCPTGGWTMNTGVGYNTPSLSGQTCTYTPKCTDGGTLYKNNAISSGDTITCTLGGSGTAACTTDNLQSKFRPFNCIIPVQCPTVGTFGTLEHGTIGTPTKPNVGSCQYALECNEGYALQGDATLQCSGTTDCGTNNLRTQLGFRQCNSSFTCPDAPEITSGTGTIGYNQTGNKCNYTLKCSTGYAEPNNNTTHTCTGTACSSGSNSVATWANGLECKAKVTCPSSKTVTHGQITMESIENGTACNYTINCNAPAYICNTANFEDQCANGFRCETAEACNTFLNMTRGIQACIFECPSKAYVMSKVPHLKTIGRMTSETQPNCTYSSASCADCFAKASGSASSIKCNDEGEQCNETGSNAWYTGIVCEWVGGDGCGPER